MTTRRLVLLTAATLGCFFNWGGALAQADTPPPPAGPTCTITHQFDTMTAQDNQPPPVTWIVTVDTSLTASCSSAWYVTFTAQCFDGGAWAQCVTNQICAFPGCGGGWTPGSSHTYNQPLGTPQGFTGYWDNGDGLTASHPVCGYAWRVRESFRRKSDAFLIQAVTTPSSGTPSC